MTERLRRGDTVRVRSLGGITPTSLIGVECRVLTPTEYGYLLTDTGRGTGMYRALEGEVQAMGVAASREQGFTGDVCFVCGGSRMVRNGSCLLCSECGQTTGCA